MARLEISGVVKMIEDDKGYWCVICGREITPEIFENGNVYIHDDIPHPESMLFNEENIIQ